MFSLIRNFRLKLENYPCIILLLGVLNGFSAVYFSPEPLSAGKIFFFATPGLLLAWGLFGLRCSCFRFIPATILAVISSLLLMGSVNGSFQEREMGNPDRLGAAAVVRLKDPSLCGGTPEWMPNTPYYIQAELQSVRIGESEEIRTKPETILLSVYHRSPDLKQAGYGDLVLVEGYFERIPEPVLRGTFDFRTYAAARGSSLVFHADSFYIRERGTGFLRRLYDWRSSFLSRLTERMPGKTARNMAPALFFGIRQSVKGGIKEDFLHSGTLHVLSVSGFHIGLFFFAMMFFLAVLPYRIRWFAAPVPVFFYALSTGMEAPAFRAFLMLTLWCLAQMFLRNNRGMNTLAAAAGVILLLNPYQLFDIGFIYSFLCVFFLILSSRFFGETATAIRVRNQFSENRKRITLSWLISKLVVVTGVSVAAWLCSLAVSLSAQALFTPWAVPAYLLMTPATWFCFILFLPAVLLQWIPGVTEWIGEILAPALEFCAGVAGTFADAGSCYVTPPPLWLSVIFLFALAGVMIFRQRRSFILCAMILAVSGFFLFFPGWNSEPEIVILRDGATPVPAILFCDPANRKAILWNVPSGNTARLISTYMKTHGIREIEEVHFDSARSDICGGGELLFYTNPPKAVYFHGKIRKNASTALRIQKEYPAPDSRPVLKLQKEKSRTEVIPGFAGMKHVKVRMITSEYKGSVLEVELPGRVLRKEYPLSNRVIVDRITLPPRKKAALQSLLSTGTRQGFPR